MLRMFGIVRRRTLLEEAAKQGLPPGDVVRRRR